MISPWLDPVRLRSRCPAAAGWTCLGEPPLIPLFVPLSLVLLSGRRTSPASPLASPPSFRTRMRDPRQQSPNLRFAVPSVAAKSPDGRQLAGLGPACHRFGIHAEHRRDLRRRQQRLSLGCACRHWYGLSSWTSTGVMRLVALHSSLRNRRGVPYSPLRPYCHHQR